MGVQLICELLRALLVIEQGPCPEGPVSAQAVPLDTEYDDSWTLHCAAQDSHASRREAAKVAPPLIKGMLFWLGKKDQRTLRSCMPSSDSPQAPRAMGCSPQNS